MASIYHSKLTNNEKRNNINDFEKYLKANPHLTTAEALYTYFESQCHYSRTDIAKITSRHYQTIRTTINNAKLKNQNLSGKK